MDVMNGEWGGMIPLRRPSINRRKKKGKKERKLHSLARNPIGTSITFHFLVSFTERIRSRKTKPVIKPRDTWREKGSALGTWHILSLHGLGPWLVGGKQTAHGKGPFSPPPRSYILLFYILK